MGLAIDLLRLGALQIIAGYGPQSRVPIQINPAHCSEVVRPLKQDGGQLQRCIPNYPALVGMASPQQFADSHGICQPRQIPLGVGFQRFLMSTVIFRAARPVATA